MTGRQVFSETEKTCLAELILKYKLNSTSTIGAGNPNVKRNLWVRLTEEFNSIETNSKRTEAQLKKCWDNLKTRRKQALALEKKERMKTGGGPYEPRPSTSQDSHATFDDGLLDLTDVEMRFVCDSDAPGDSQVIIDVVDDEDTDPSKHVQPEPVSVDIPQSTPIRRGSGTRRSGSRLSDYGTTGTSRNVRTTVITQEFEIWKENYLEIQRRDEELHRLKLVEQEWLNKAAKEKFHTAELERENAEEILKCNRIKREQAELELSNLKKM